MRLLIVSNRLPITIEEQESGELLIKQSVGGLVSGISDYLSRLKFSEFLKPDYVWIGFSGIDVDSKQKEKLSKKLFQHYNAWPVFLSKRVVDKFYHGFCNKILWPLFHSFPSYVEWNDEYWQTYIDVNKIFAQEILKIAKEDDIIWIHDYHLMLLPSMLRKEIDNAKIIFSLHIPFPHFEIFQLLPKAWRTGLLKGLLGADIVGFHTYEYSQNFLQSVLRFLGYQNEMGKILTDEGLVKVGTFPMGINFQKFHFALEDQEILSKVETLKEKFKNYKVILSIDRLDYTKGILNRLKAYEQFLKDNPQYFDKVVLIIVVVPGRVGVERYQKTKNEIDEYVGKINGEFGNIEWTPVIYQTKFLPFEDLAVFYNIADVMLVTPLRDGMNLIAKEYVASKKDAKGVLILSEMAGAAKELTEAILVNPYDISEIASAIKEALEMPVEEQTRRNKIMQNRLRKYDIARWGDELIKELLSIKDEQNKFSTKLLVPRLQEKLYSEYKKATIIIKNAKNKTPLALS
ncbi:bifunctional alpha,alpha-trehalose-phosphate synthase (UDP-forming)/trehalose-phosphatase, partial [Candidatus Kryptonium thompsonii]|uniref:bifunctional alpha,alpha-trehalose-phosphate synthase (UDP-forming)/trehalose-phosphatase n=1 Tax=Candidatus Kryptonium thompsonii TaxID=1633631 RepID=UPI0007073FD0